MEVLNLTVQYEMNVYNGDEFVGSYITEYPKELRKHLEQSKFLSEKLGIKETYRFFKRIFKVLDNKKITNECYEVTESEII